MTPTAVGMTGRVGQVPMPAPRDNEDFCRHHTHAQALAQSTLCPIVQTHYRIVSSVPKCLSEVLKCVHLRSWTQSHAQVSSALG